MCSAEYTSVKYLFDKQTVCHIEKSLLWRMATHLPRDNPQMLVLLLHLPPSCFSEASSTWALPSTLTILPKHNFFQVQGLQYTVTSTTSHHRHPFVPRWLASGKHWPLELVISAPQHWAPTMAQGHELHQSDVWEFMLQFPVAPFCQGEPRSWNSLPGLYSRKGNLETQSISTARVPQSTLFRSTVVLSVELDGEWE